ncbi:unnamed protein product [Soboliphyme baturini]|uniref:Signal peptidase complex subunit 3 n=1 Tax=Soboliphyme baturini TaxID=241478 RepID=A0A183IL50_9BILA|nr:unnamed protein product [Soboliphyme baturini]
MNQVVIWDKIVLRDDNTVINIKGAHPKYYFWDDGNGLKGNKNVTLVLSWNVIPNAGYLSFFGSPDTHSFSFPAEYTASRLS